MFPTQKQQFYFCYFYYKATVLRWKAEYINQKEIIWRKSELASILIVLRSDTEVPYWRAYLYSEALNECINDLTLDKS